MEEMLMMAHGQHRQQQQSMNTSATTGTGGHHHHGSTSSEDDSSYDSDYCYSEDSSSNNYANNNGSRHGLLDRTDSDTLAQEFSEYVNTNVKDETQLSPISQTQSLGSNNNSNSSYVAKVEFERKLGFSEEQVKIALSKLGQSATQNELLAELVQLGSGSKGAIGGVRSPSIFVEPPESTNVPKLRPVVIDGSNVAKSHGSNKIFSCRGIQLAVDYFRNRGHQEITVFVPMFRKENNPDDPVLDYHILTELEAEKKLVWTPSKKVNNKLLVCYDDRYILKLAAETDGIVVSNDNYRDLTNESPSFKQVVEERTLMYSFVNDRFMPPEDPLGRHGPSLDQFLMKNTTPRTTKQTPCPYGHKCTFGVKCKYFHSTQKVSVSDVLRKQAAMKTTSLPIFYNNQEDYKNVVKMTCTRTKSSVVGTNSSVLLQTLQPFPFSSSSSSSSSTNSSLPFTTQDYHNSISSSSSPLSSSSGDLNSDSNLYFNNNNNNNNSHKNSNYRNPTTRNIINK